MKILYRFAGVQFPVIALALIILLGCEHQPEEPDCSTLIFTSTVVNENCSDSDGEISVVASGGDENYVYRLGDGDFQSSGTFTGLEHGTYLITVIDGNECQYSDSVLVEIDPGNLAFTTDITEAGCGTNKGVITINVTGGAGGFEYSLDGFTFGTSSTFTNLTSGDYNVSVMDSNGCTESEMIYLPSGGVSYSTDIAPIISASCGVSNCHDGSNSFRATLTNYNGLFNNRVSSLSRLKSGSMPKSPGTISSADRAMVICWLEDGAPNN